MVSGKEERLPASYKHLVPPPLRQHISLLPPGLVVLEGSPSVSEREREGKTSASGNMSLSVSLARLPSPAGMPPCLRCLLPTHRSPQSLLEAPSSTKAPSRATALGSSAFKDLVTSICPLGALSSWVWRRNVYIGVEDRGSLSGSVMPLKCCWKLGSTAPEISTIPHALPFASFTLSF